MNTEKIEFNVIQKKKKLILLLKALPVRLIDLSKFEELQFCVFFLQGNDTNFVIFTRILWTRNLTTQSCDSPRVWSSAWKATSGNVIIQLLKTGYSRLEEGRRVYQLKYCVKKYRIVNNICKIHIQHEDCCLDTRKFNVGRFFLFLVGGCFAIENESLLLIIT